MGKLRHGEAATCQKSQGQGVAEAGFQPRPLEPELAGLNHPPTHLCEGAAETHTREGC